MQKVAYNNNFYLLLYATAFCFGGDSQDWTDGLGIANATLSQLSYIPTLDIFFFSLFLTCCQQQ